MGHNRLGLLPRTYRWKQVIGLLDTGADLSEIARASFHAAQNGLDRVPGDPGFAQVLTTICKFIEAARSPDFVQALRQSGYDIASDASALELINGVRSKVDKELERGQIKSDVSDIAQNAFSEALISAVSSDLPSLFEATPEESQRSVSKRARGKQLTSLMHEFYARFTKRYLAYYLSRELPTRVGSKKYFEDIESHTAFNDALDLYLRQTVRISDEFTPGWLGKAVFEDTLNEASVKRYANVAFKKIAREFARGSGNGH